MAPQPVAPPNLHIPASASTVHVQIIDTTSNIQGLLTSFFSPAIEGHTRLDIPSFAFLVTRDGGGEGGKKRRVLFDLGIRKDFARLAPRIAKYLNGGEGWTVRVEKDVVEILEDGGVEAVEVEAMVWSHWHWDHVGDPSRFPPETKLIVGPGFKKEFVPDLAFPAAQNGLVLESDWEGRELVEIEFPPDLKIGNFKAFDYFGDGSFYLLDSPGHATGHMCALARVTPTSFVFMGGDACHHNGEFRPSPFRPLPDSISPHPFDSTSKNPCPGSLFEKILRDGDKTKAFYEMKKDEKGGSDLAVDVEEAERTIGKVVEVDAQERVLVAMAHDDTLLGVVDFFPGYLDGFVEKGWVEESRWSFLKDFKEAVEL